MNLETRLESGLSYVGAVDGARQRYSVFEATDTFMVFSLSQTKPNSGNFNLVSRKAVEYVHRKFCGQKRVTSTYVVEQSRRTKHAPTTLLALNILYVLVAKKYARIDGVGSHSKLFFSILKPDLKSPMRRNLATKKAYRKQAVPKVAKQVAKKKVRRKKAVREHGGKRYRQYIVETFLSHGEQSTSKIRIRPVAGQRLSTGMRVKCGKTFRSRHQIGTRFKMWATISDREGGTPFLYSPYIWEPEVLQV